MERMVEVIGVIMGFWIVGMVLTIPRRLRQQAFWAFLSVGFLAVCAISWAIAGYMLMTVLCFIAMALCSLWGLASGYSERKFWRRLSE